MRLHVGNIRPVLGIEQHIKMKVFPVIVLFQVSYVGWQRLSTVRMTEGVLQEKEKASCMVTGIHALREVRYFISTSSFGWFLLIWCFLMNARSMTRHLFACRNSKEAWRADKKGGKSGQVQWKTLIVLCRAPAERYFSCLIIVMFWKGWKLQPRLGVY